MQALALGYAAPEFFSRIVAEQPARPIEEGVAKSEEFSVRRWWSR